MQLKLKVRDCISCGICMDVCAPGAIHMRNKTPRCIEGPVLSCLCLEDAGPTQELMTFPYLAYPEKCDGCQLCVIQCPVQALELIDLS